MYPALVQLGRPTQFPALSEARAARESQIPASRANESAQETPNRTAAFRPGHRSANAAPSAGELGVGRSGQPFSEHHLQVFPTDDTIPSFRTLLERSEPALAELIHARTGLLAAPQLNLSLREAGTNRVLPLDLDGPALWPDTSYAWFSVSGVPGGTDAYFDRSDTNDRSIWLEEIQSEHYASWAEHVHSALRVGHSWRFRRSAGQPAVISIAYAVIAAQLRLATDEHLASLGTRR